MAKQADAKLTTRNARASLPVGLHWRAVDADIHLGYRKAKKGGRWLVRHYLGDKKYAQEVIGTADDEVASGNLDYSAAVRAAFAAVARKRAEAEAEAAGPVVTVRMAVVDYIAGRDARDSKRAGRAVKSDAARRMERYVIGRPAEGRRKAVDAAPIADMSLGNLKEGDLRAWREAITGLKPTSQRRLFNDFKAALNAASEKHSPRLADLAAITKTLKVRLSDDEDSAEVARENQILTDAQVTVILAAAKAVDDENGWEGDLYRLIAVMAATGARFAQIVRMRIGDVQRDAGRLMVPASRKGRGGGKAAHTPVPVGADILTLLLPATTGRARTAALFERWRHVRVPGVVPIQWKRAGRGPWKTPSELVRPWHAIRERAGLPDVIPYALRHSSIVRGIRANLPIRLVAALHDTSVAMIERHYGRWVADGLDALAASAVVPLLPADEGNVVRISEKVGRERKSK